MRDDADRLKRGRRLAALRRTLDSIRRTAGSAGEGRAPDMLWSHGTGYKARETISRPVPGSAPVPGDEGPDAPTGVEARQAAQTESEPSHDLENQRAKPGIQLDDAGLSVRSRNALAAIGVSTLEEVTRLPRTEIARARNVGTKSVNDIKLALTRHGLTFAPEPAEPDPEHPSSGPPQDARTAAMIAQRRAGATLAEIADAHGLSRQRVLQLLDRAGFTGAVAREQIRAAGRESVEARTDVILTAFRRGDTTRQIAQMTALPERAIRDLLADEVTAADRTQRRGSRAWSAEPRYSDDDLIAAVREVGERYGRAPTTGEYNRAAAGGLLPSVPTITNRLGWAAALERAGFAAPIRRRTYEVRWTEAACRHALRRLVIESGHVPTTMEYEQLAQLDDSLPSSATLRNRLGPWSALAAELARLPSSREALLRAGLDPEHQGDADSHAIWMSYLEEILSDEDLVVLLISGAFSWSDEFGTPPTELRDVVAAADVKAAATWISLQALRDDSNEITGLGRAASSTDAVSPEGERRPYASSFARRPVGPGDRAASETLEAPPDADDPHPDIEDLDTMDAEAADHVGPSAPDDLGGADFDEPHDSRFDEEQPIVEWQPAHNGTEPQEPSAVERPLTMEARAIDLTSLDALKNAVQTGQRGPETLASAERPSREMAASPHRPPDPTTARPAEADVASPNLKPSNAFVREWTDERILAVLTDFMVERDTWPSSTEMLAAGLGGVYRAAVRHGGISFWRDQLGFDEDGNRRRLVS